MGEVGNNIMQLSEKYFLEAEFLKALAHPIRLKILRNLLNKPMFVYEIQNVIGVSQSLISQHLAILRRADIVIIKKKNARIEYKIVDSKIIPISELLAQ